MEQKIQLKHPTGKKAVRMDKHKYDAIKKSLLHFLKTIDEATHSEIVEAVREDFKKNKKVFEGALEWHLEWVKLDLEAEKQIRRMGDKAPVRFALAKK